MSETSGLPVPRQSQTAHFETGSIDPSLQASAASASLRPEGTAPASTRRRSYRAVISAPVRIRSANTRGASFDEIASTVDVSRTGILFETTSFAYSHGTDVLVTFPYSDSPSMKLAERPAHVARITESANGSRAIAVMFRSTNGENQTTQILPGQAGTQAVADRPVKAGEKRPLILAVDADDKVRGALKAHLHGLGYEVIAVHNAASAREALTILTPSLVIAEIEGEDMPGYEICAHVKRDPRLRHIPVILTTQAANPTDYADAHSLGAVVCMAKPYRQDRLDHVVRLVAPLPHANDA
jgi:CheY-like chemotaxis protein/Tfp pilus assembly protein PilZ